MIFESHAHYDDDAFLKDRESLLKSLAENQIGYVINVAASLESISTTIQLTKQYDFIYGSVGVHPSETAALDETNFRWLLQQCRQNKIVAVGEIGLDYYWDEPGRDIQKKWFARQLQAAHELDLPVIIHSRDAAQDTYDIMKAERAQDLKGVIHCFSYSKETARDYLNMGYYFGIGGVVTFSNAKKLKEAVSYIPMENILLETDSPYLAPVPNRGKRNTSLNLSYIAAEIAAIKGMDYEKVIETTSSNAKKLFKIH